MKSKFVLSRGICVLSALCFSSSAAYAGAYSPTTTISAETGMNTSQSPLFTDVYYDYVTKATGATNQDTPNQHISKLPIRSLLTGAAAKAKIYVETQSWFCHDTSNESGGKMIPSSVCGSHKDIGHNSGDASVVTAQYNDMVSRGVDGVVIDWDGQPSSSSVNIQNNAAINNFRKLAEASGGKFTFAVSEDEGVAACTKGWSPCATWPGVATGANSQAISDINYIVKTWVPSKSYIKDAAGRPIIYVFGLDAYATMNWATIKANLNGNPVLIFENSTTHADAGGAYAWETPTAWSGYSLAGSNAFSQSYLASVYSSMASAPASDFLTASVFKGFDDGIVNGWGGGPRYVDQQCGQTWLSSFDIANKYFATRALDAIWLVTWDDYEEATEMETGIKNCMSGLNPTISGSVVSWSPAFGKSFDGVAGTENTVSSYDIFVSTDGTNLMLAGSVAAPTHKFDLASAALPANTYKVYVEAVGKPMISNYFATTPLTYAVKGSATTGTLTGQVTNITSGAVISGAAVSTGAGSTTTNASGVYTISNVTAGNYAVAVTASGFIAHTVSASVAAGATSTMNVPMATGGILAGVVTNKASGANLSGASVLISGGAVATSMDITASSTGAYNTGWIPIGTYTVTCSMAGYTTLTLTGVNLSPAGATVTANCPLVATVSKGTLTGTVTNITSGTVISGAAVSTSAGSATTNASGVYTISNVAAGTYSIAVTASGFIARTVSASVTAGTTTTANVPMATGGILAGTVTNKSSGAVLSGATVAISGGVVATTMNMTSSSTGAYNTSWIPIGTYTVTCSMTGYTTLTLTGVNLSPAGATVTANCPLTAIASKGTLTGKITNATSGAVVSGAAVSTSAGSATTNASGVYTISNVAAGTYSVTVTASGFITHTVSTSVAAGATTTLNVPVAAGGILAGTVKNKSSGAVLSGATVKIVGGAVATTMTMTTSSSGAYNSNWIPVGTYTVTCSKSGFTTQTLSGQVLNAGATLTVNCSL